MVLSICVTDLGSWYMEKCENSLWKSTSGIIGRTREESFLVEWETAYHEMLDTSNSFNDLPQSSQGFREVELPTLEVSQFILKCGNQYETDEVVKIYHIV